MAELTKDAEKLLCQIYKRYLEQRKSGVAKSSAKELGGSDNVLVNLGLAISRDDLDETMRELGRAGYLMNRYADDTIYISTLSDTAIIYMENRFKDGVIGVAQFLAQFIP